MRSHGHIPAHADAQAVPTGVSALNGNGQGKPQLALVKMVVWCPLCSSSPAVLTLSGRPPCSGRG